jgi:integrative and conjugative element protein (TIGR02256 family)
MVGLAWVAAPVLAALRVEADRAFPLETGGVLLGYWVTPGEEVVLAEIVGPGPAAHHAPRRFRPDRGYQELEIARRYEASGRYHTYLGDWHTHPRAAPDLSHLDRRTLGAIARDRDARAVTPLMAVLGHGAPWSLVVWCRIPDRRLLGVPRPAIVPLRPRPYPALPA